MGIIVTKKVVGAILNGKKNNNDLTDLAQEIIDSYVLLEYKKKKATGLINAVLWGLVAAAVALTLFLYIYLR